MDTNGEPTIKRNIKIADKKRRNERWKKYAENDEKGNEKSRRITTLKRDDKKVTKEGEKSLQKRDKKRQKCNKNWRQNVIKAQQKNAITKKHWKKNGKRSTKIGGRKGPQRKA